MQCLCYGQIDLMGVQICKSVCASILRLGNGGNSTTLLTTTSASWFEFHCMNLKMPVFRTKDLVHPVLARSHSFSTTLQPALVRLFLICRGDAGGEIEPRL